MTFNQAVVSCDSPVAVTHTFSACKKRVSEEHETVKADGGRLTTL